MNANFDPSMNAPIGAMPGQMPATPLGTKLLWGSVAVLGVAVLAMGATLVNLHSQNQAATVQRTQGKAQAPAELLALAPPAAGLAHTGTGAAASLAPGETLVTDKQVPPTIVIHNHMPPPAATEPMRPVYQSQRPAAPVQRVQAVQAAPTMPSAQVAHAPQATPVVVPAAVPVAITAPTPGAPQVVAQAPSQHAPVVYSGYPPVAQQPSSTLGTVESVTPVQRSAKAGGLGVVAGGVLGAIVGNQIGKGSGRTLGTIVGAVGGGIAGNAIEKQMKKETVYQVGVRMDDGSLRTMEQASAPAIGSRIDLKHASQAAITAPTSPSTSPAMVTPGSERV